MTLCFHLHVVGALLTLLGLSHVFFSRYFDWERELAPVSLLTRQVFFVHTFFIGLGVMMAGAGSFFYAVPLLRPGALSRAILAGMVAFWLLRLMAQFFAYDPAIWRGDPFRTFMHVVFAVLWIYVTATYGSALWSVWNRS
jgi:hypothetical protein